MHAPVFSGIIGLPRERSSSPSQTYAPDGAVGRAPTITQSTREPCGLDYRRAGLREQRGPHSSGGAAFGLVMETGEAAGRRAASTEQTASCAASYGRLTPVAPVPGCRTLDEETRLGTAVPCERQGRQSGRRRLQESPDRGTNVNPLPRGRRARPLRPFGLAETSREKARCGCRRINTPSANHLGLAELMARVIAVARQPRAAGWWPSSGKLVAS